MKKILAILAAVAVMVAFSVPASAAEWSFYGSSRMTTFWDDLDKDAGDDADLTWMQQSNSRIGANVKAGDVFGRFEYGDGPNLRLLYGGWNFGAGTLTIGQMYTPFMTLYSNQVWGSDNDLVGLRRHLHGPAGRDPVHLRRPEPGLCGEQRQQLRRRRRHWTRSSPSWKPAICSRWAASPWNWAVCTRPTSWSSAPPRKSVDTWGVNLGATMSVGPVALKASGYVGQNLANAGFISGPPAGAAFAGGRVVDNDAYGFQFIAGYTLSDMVSLEAGYGYSQGELDVSGSDKDDAQSYYIQAVLSLAKGVYIIPEIGVVDNMENAAGVDQGKRTYFGAKWQINF